MTIRIVTAETLELDKQKGWALYLRASIADSFQDLRWERIAREREIEESQFVGPKIDYSLFCDCCGQRLPEDQV